MWTPRYLMLPTLSTADPLMVMGVLSLSLPPKVHHKLLGFVSVENEVVVLAVLSQAVALATIGRVIG